MFYLCITFLCLYGPVIQRIAPLIWDQPLDHAGEFRYRRVEQLRSYNRYAQQD